jgi:VanZ family protein
MIFKSFHLIEYGILFILSEWSFRLHFRKTGKTIHLGRFRFHWGPAWAAFLLVVVYGASDEFHQTFVPTREGKLRDVLIDGLGGWLAWWLQIRWQLNGRT